MSTEALILDNLKLVGYIVRDVMTRLPAHIDRDDLISAGNEGLVLAARDYDDGRGVPFSRYAHIRIYGAVITELRSMDWASRSVRPRARAAEAARSDLAVSLGRSPRPQELADALGLSVADLAKLDADVHRASLLSIQGVPSETGAAMVPDDTPDPERQLLDRELSAYLTALIAALPDRLHFVVYGSFIERRLMADIAADLGVTESRISQLRSAGVKLLRLWLADAGQLAA